MTGDARPENPVEDALARFIAAEIAYERAEPRVEPEEPLLNGLVDSTGVLRLVVFAEEQFGVAIADEDLVPENFATVRSLGELVERKRAETA